MATQEWQHIYLGLLYGLLTLKSVLVDDFAALRIGAIGPVKITRMTTREATIFWGGKATFAILGVVLPLVHGHLAWGSLVLAWLVAQLMAGWLLAFLFQVSWESTRLWR